MRYVSYYLDFFTMPLFAALSLLTLPAAPWAWLGLFLLGLLSWTLVEYWIHRHLFHRVFRREHWMHHLQPDSMDGAVPSALTHAVGLGVLYCSVALLGRHGVALTSGLTVGYLGYALLHHGIHRGWFSDRGALGGVVRRHDLHHSGVEANFNFVLPVGDWIFGTYQGVPRED